jgi:hypothetical protein
MKQPIGYVVIVIASRASRFNLRGESPVPTGYDAGWNPTPIWTFSRRDKSLRLPGTNHDSSVVEPVALSLRILAATLDPYQILLR